MYLFLESAAADVLIYLMMNLDAKITFSTITVSNISLLQGSSVQQKILSTWLKNEARIPKK